MTEPKFKISSVPTTDELHLYGGIRAFTSKDNGLVMWPTVEGNGVENASVSDKRAYRQAFTQVGLDLIGWEAISEINGTTHSTWYLFDSDTGMHGIDDWAGVAYAAHLAKDAEAESVARHISFSMNAASLRLRDISQAYHFQCLHVVQSKIGCGRRFQNVEMFDLYMALHSFLTEACSARDYLARFIALRVSKFAGSTKIGTMNALFQRLMKEGSNNEPLLHEILAICDKAKPDSWMARLGRFRNLIVHEAPIRSLSKDTFLVANPVEISGRILPSIYVDIPSDPFSDTPTFVDALAHFRGLMLRLLSFSKSVITASPIKPRIPHFTDADLRP